MPNARTRLPLSLSMRRSNLVSGLLPALCLVLGLGACGGSTTTKPRDAAAEAGGTGGLSGSTGGTSGIGTGGGGGTAGNVGGATGTGGGAAGTGGGSPVGTGGVAGTGGAGSGDAAADRADVPVTPDASFPFDLPIPTDITLPDGAPAIIPCPADITNATCTNNTVCLRVGSSGMPEGCGCAMQRWFCPGSLVDAGAPSDAGFPDVPGVAACPTGVATGVTCAAENEVCAGGPGLGCACVPLAGGLRWFCL
jgi:hypothetical protein